MLEGEARRPFFFSCLRAPSLPWSAGRGADAGQSREVVSAARLAARVELDSYELSQGVQLPPHSPSARRCVARLVRRSVQPG